ncbi:MAG: hypothetical protein K2R98_01365 [Gemmataceae bacterium]|nr:hypothetical protein [Gemmataceae bacterium]
MKTSLLVIEGVHAGELIEIAGLYMLIGRGPQCHVRPNSPADKAESRNTSRGMSSFMDVMPPTTMITSAIREGNLIRVRGSVADASDIKKVTVNGKAARSTRGSYAEWEITLEAPPSLPFEVSAVSEDVNGHVEPRPHKIRVD